MCQYKAGGFPHLTYVDKEKTVADVNAEIEKLKNKLETARQLIDVMNSEQDGMYTNLKSLLRRALNELDRQEKLINNLDCYTVMKDILEDCDEEHLCSACAIHGMDEPDPTLGKEIVEALKEK